MEIEDDISLLDFVGIKIELEEATGRKVDLVEYDTIKPLLQERILNEQVVILVEAKKEGVHGYIYHERHIVC